MARILADLLRANLIAKVHICGKATRDLKEMPSAAICCIGAAVPQADP